MTHKELIEMSLRVSNVKHYIDGISYHLGFGENVDSKSTINEMNRVDNSKYRNEEMTIEKILEALSEASEALYICAKEKE